jgi:hypothetical protein
MRCWVLHRRQDEIELRSLWRRPRTLFGRSVPALDAGDYVCDRIQAAKTEQFLGIHSDATISAAIKDSESDDPDERTLASVIFSFVRTPEAIADLKTLAQRFRSNSRERCERPALARIGAHSVLS